MVMQGEHVYALQDLVMEQLLNAFVARVHLHVDASLDATEEFEEMMARTQGEGNQKMGGVQTSAKGMIERTTYW